MLGISLHPTGPRLYLAGRRVHHGLVGLVMAAIGITLTIHDWHDRPWPIRDWAQQ